MSCNPRDCCEGGRRCEGGGVTDIIRGSVARHPVHPHHYEANHAPPHHHHPGLRRCDHHDGQDTEGHPQRL